MWLFPAPGALAISVVQFGESDGCQRGVGGGVGVIAGAVVSVVASGYEAAGQAGGVFGAGVLLELVVVSSLQIVVELVAVQQAAAWGDVGVCWRGLAGRDAEQNGREECSGKQGDPDWGFAVMPDDHCAYSPAAPFASGVLAVRWCRMRRLTSLTDTRRRLRRRLAADAVSAAQLDCTPAGGLSPRVRGKRGSLPPHPPHRRSIPACAGETWKPSTT